MGAEVFTVVLAAAVLVAVAAAGPAVAVDFQAEVLQVAGEIEIPSWLQRRLSADDYKRVEQAVEHAEKTTSGEIVPMIVRSSSTYGHVSLILFLLIWGALQTLGLGEAGGEWSSAGRVWIIPVVQLILSGGLAWLLGRSSWVRRRLIPKADQIQQVEERAELEFYRSQIQQTRDSTGVLIFVSLMEHRVVVLADHAIDEKLPKGTWQGLVDELLRNVRSKKMGSGFENAIAHCGKLLAEHFPISADDTNELRNHLVIVE